MQWVVGLLLLAQAKEFDERVARVAQQAADGHASIGDWLRDQKMHEWARLEYAYAARLVPKHERANKALGRTKWNADDERWEEDPEAKRAESGNQKRGDEIAKTWVEYQKRLEQHGKKVAKMYVELAGWCARSEPGRAPEVWQRVVLAEPDHAEARAKLGHVKPKGGFWMSKDVEALRKEMRDGIAKADKGKPVAEKSDTEVKLGIKIVRQATKRIEIESSHLDAKTLERLVQLGEHAYVMFHKLFAQPPSWESPMILTILKDQAQHDTFVNVYYAESTEEERKHAKELGRTVYEIAQADHKIGAIEDWVIHRTIMTCCYEWLNGERLGLHEGLAEFFTRTMHDSAHWHCTQFSTATGQRTGKETWPEPAKWGEMIRDGLRAAKDPDINTIFRCEDASQFRMPEGIKAWSLMEFLISQHREPFLDFMQRIRQVEPAGYEKELVGAMGWSVEDLDRHWRAWARSAYGAAEK